jgi:hypothetical protein
LADLVAHIRSEPESTSWGLHLVSHASRGLDVLRGQDAEATAPYVRETHGEERSWRMVERGLERIGRVAKEDGAQLLLAIMPLLFDLDPYAFEDVHAQVADAGRRKGFAVMDLTGVLRGYAPAALRLDPGDVSHPNALGHRLIAEALAPAIVRLSTP